MIPYTMCNGCVFSETENNEQTGCRLNRADKIGIQDKDDDGFFALSRFCSTYRPTEWLSDLSLAESEDIVDTVRKEVHPPVGFFVLLKTEDIHGITDLKSTLEDIKAQELITPSYVVVITDKVEYSEEALKVLDGTFGHTETKYHIVQLQITPDDIHKRIDQAFSHAKNGWAYVTSSGESVPRDLLRKIDNRVNSDMKQLVVIKPYDEINGLLFQTALFKFVNGNKSKLHSDEISDSRSFLEKIEDASLRSKDDTFITWEEFNAS
tara:strand:- start:296 stop:1090 length:795 start_codon:yes stop_codon:yes gene_type:complete